MKAQKPAMGILQTANWQDAKSYLVECECTDPNHAHNVWVEKDKDLDSISVTVYTKQTSPFWKASRWKLMWQLLTKGYVEVESTILFGKQQAINYAETIKTAVKDLSK